MICTALGNNKANAQAAPLYSQYIFNMMLINPAYAGSKDQFQTNALYRSQWSGLDGSPQTQTLVADGPLNDNVGLGGHLINDRVGAFGRTSLYGNYAYRLDFGSSKRLSFGISFGASYFSLNATRLSTDEPGDPAIENAYESSMMPDAKGGIFYHNKDFYAGLSMGEMLAGIDFAGADLFTRNREYMFTAGMTTYLFPDILFKPSILIKEDFHAPTNVDLNAFVLLSEQLWVGSSFRLGSNLFKNSETQGPYLSFSEIAIMSEFYFDAFRIGYSYGYNINFEKYPTHEISLGFVFNNESDYRDRDVSPRHF